MEHLTAIPKSQLKPVGHNAYVVVTIISPHQLQLYSSVRFGDDEGVDVHMTITSGFKNSDKITTSFSFPATTIFSCSHVHHGKPASLSLSHGWLPTNTRQPGPSLSQVTRPTPTFVGTFPLFSSSATIPPRGCVCSANIDPHNPHTLLKAL